MRILVRILAGARMKPSKPMNLLLPTLTSLSLFLAPHAQAQQATDNHSHTSEIVMGLTPGNFQIVTRLTAEALKRSSLTLEAQRNLATAQQDEELATRLLDNLSLNAAAGVASNSGYEQVKPTFSVSASFDVIGFANTSPSQLPELQAKLAEAKHQVHQQVLTAYLAYRQALDSAHLAADTLDTT